MVRLMVFGARALAGTTLHTRLDEFRAAGIELAVVGTEWDGREVENTGLILNTANVGIASDKVDALSDTNTLIHRFMIKVGCSESETVVVSDSELHNLAARYLHCLYVSPRALDILLARSGSIENALGWLT